MLKLFSHARMIFFITTASLILLLLSIININLLDRFEFVNSIYTYTPFYFWILISVNYFNGLISIYFGDKYKVNSLIKYGFIILFLTNIILFNLHIFENFTFLDIRGDTATYLGFIKDIILNGSFNNNFYPLLFSLISILSITSNYDYLILAQIIPTLFYIIYFIFMYYWIKNIHNNFEYKIYTMLLSLPLYFSIFTTYFYPQFLSILLLPMVQYISIKELKNIKFSYIVVIIFFVIPLFHIITAFFLLIYRLIWILYNLFFQKIKKDTLKRIMLTTTFFMTAFFFWNINQLSIVKTFIELINNILSGFKNTTLDISQQYISSLGIFGSIKNIFIMNVDEIILYILSLFVIVYLFRKNHYRKLFSTILCLIIGTGIYCLFFVITQIHGALRLLNLDLNILFCIPIIPIYLIIENRKKYLKKLYFLLIAFLFFTTTISLYESPPFMTYTFDYATKSELQGAKWLIINNSFFIPTTSIESPIIRYSHYLFDTTSNISLILSENWISSPNHFNITKQNYNSKEVLLFIPENDYTTYTSIWNFTGRFTSNDFLRIESNTSKIFDNNGFKLYIIYIK